MSQADKALVDTLLTTLDNAYAPYSNHPVAAVMECPDGQQFAGANVEVAHYKGLCAEASAISAMITAGQRELPRCTGDGTRRAPVYTLRRLPPAHS